MPKYENAPTDKPYFDGSPYSEVDVFLTDPEVVRALATLKRLGYSADEVLEAMKELARQEPAS